MIGALLSLALLRWTPFAYVGVIVFAPLALLGLFHVSSRRRTLSRNYPILIQFRYFLESIGPEFRQYFIESDHDERPFAREQRVAIYQRAKGVRDNKPFGTQLNVYATDYEWINHSIRPLEKLSHDFRVVVGAEAAQPYSASIFNISAMSFGSISPNAIRALNAGAARGHFYHDTGEGSISRYHREHGGDLVWEIGSGYFGCRDEHGHFDAERFAAASAADQVKMIEIKLSQGAKPGQGGILPAAKVNREIAEARGVPPGADVISPARHTAFSTPFELLQFVARLRELSGGKPVGFKLALGHPWEWFAIVKAMLECELLPDFIVVDGGEGGTGAAPLEFINRVGVPLREALMLVNNTLVGVELRHRIRIAAAGKITSGFHIARTMALGADWCNAARGYMFALGCIQSLSCHTDHCPTGIATQDRARWRNLDVTDKGQRVFNYHRSTLRSVASLVAAAGLEHPALLTPEHIIRRVDEHEVRSYESLFPMLQPGELLHGKPAHEVFARFWAKTRPDSFEQDIRA
ncbi:MAG: FMN-binding glutamate synthase family protein [Gammaproteobacteria bacterium]